jgi:hypothetical protein
MDILAYNYLYDGLVDFNDKSGKPRGNVIVHYPTANPTYPYTVFDEIRNVANPSYNTCFDRVSSTGYVARIYAKTKGKVDKQTIAREVAQMVDKYLTYCGLLRISYNANESVNDNSIYEIIMTYSGNLHENRRNLI